MTEARLFRRAMACFATGVAIVTSKSEQQLYGMTVNSLTSVSLKPPLLLVCLAHNSRTRNAIIRSGHFAVNILSSRQAYLSERFSRPGEDHFRDIRVRPGEHDLPLIPGCLAYFICRVQSRYAEGDHDIIVASVQQTEVQPGSPLLFFRSQYHALADNPADFWYW